MHFALFARASRQCRLEVSSDRFFSEPGAARLTVIVRSRAPVKIIEETNVVEGKALRLENDIYAIDQN